MRRRNSRPLLFSNWLTIEGVDVTLSKGKQTSFSLDTQIQHKHPFDSLRYFSFLFLLMPSLEKGLFKGYVPGLPEKTLFFKSRWTLNVLRTLKRFTKNVHLFQRIEIKTSKLSLLLGLGWRLQKFNRFSLRNCRSVLFLIFSSMIF